MISLSPIMSKGVTGCALVLGLMLGASVEATAVTARQPLINGRIDETQRVTLPGSSLALLSAGKILRLLLFLR